MYKDNWGCGMYFVIHGDDGDVYIETLTKRKLEEYLNSDWYGTAPLFLDAIPDENALYWPQNSYLIIKGEIVKPVPENVVTKWRMDE